VTVSPQGREPTAVKVSATVYGFQLPARGHLKTAFALMDGFLYWGLNIWSRRHNDRPIDPADGPLLNWGITTSGTRWTRLHGDGVLLYPGTRGPIGSIRLANIRDGLENYEYLWLLAEKLGDRDAAREACLPVARSLTSFTRDPDALGVQRERIARQIEGR